jgi:hypothetical protein
MPVASRGAAMLATRAQGSVQGNLQENAHVKIARHGAKMMTAAIDTGEPANAPIKDGAKEGVKQSTKQLAASKHNQRKLQVSQR